MKLTREQKIQNVKKWISNGELTREEEILLTQSNFEKIDEHYDFYVNSLLHIAKTNMESFLFEQRSRQAMKTPTHCYFLKVIFTHLNLNEAALYGIDIELDRKFCISVDLIKDYIEFEKETFICVDQNKITFLEDDTQRSIDIAF